MTNREYMARQLADPDWIDDGGAYSLEQIVQIIGLAGFGGGIGSGRSSGYGRYHIASVSA